MVTMIKIIFVSFKELIHNIYSATTYFIKSNMYNIAELLEVICPYIMLRLAYYLYDVRGCISIGFEVLIPLITFIVAETIKRICNKVGQGYEIPVPDKLFIQSKGDMYYIDVERYEDLVLYMAELEEYFKKVGKI